MNIKLPLLSVALTSVSVMTLGCARGSGERSDQPPAATRRVEIQNKGSDSLVNVAQAWAESYRKVNPGVAIAVSGGGSGTAMAALISGTVDIANSSRLIKAEELAAAASRGVHPKEYVVGYDALAVFLHPNNPLRQLTLGQLADIYGELGTSDKWSDLGVTVPGCSRNQIVRLGRQNNSGTAEYFREAVLGESHEFRLGSRDLQGSQEIVDVVGATPCAIGYSGLAYANDEVRVPCIMNGNGVCVVPNQTSALDKSYPIARPLLMYTSADASDAVQQYIEWVRSDVGQCIIQSKGYAPIRGVNCQ